MATPTRKKVTKHAYRMARTVTNTTERVAKRTAIRARMAALAVKNPSVSRDARLLLLSYRLNNL